jgi:O-succinylbenzoate synthase
VLGGTRGTIAVGESVSIMESIDATLAHIEHAREKGYVRMKIKIKPGWDVQVIDAIRNRFGAIDLMVDGNSAYTLEHVSVFKELDKYDLTMVEQPLADDDIIDHATLQKQITTSVCLDESVLSAEDARKAIEIGACKIINIKPGRVGGLTESKKIHDVAQEHGIGVWCGGMLETGIGRAYNIASASLPNYVYPADMSPVHEFYADDLVSPSFVVESNGHVSVPTVAGIGFDVLEEKVNTYTITSETFT